MLAVLIFFFFLFEAQADEIAFLPSLGVGDEARQFKWLQAELHFVRDVAQNVFFFHVKPKL